MHQKNTAIDVPLVTFTLNGQNVVTRADQTILQAADDHGIEVPRLCYMEGMRADGNCRTCMVEIKGERVLAASCCRYPKDGMEVTTNSARAVASQKMSLELLLSDIPETSYTLDSELDLWAKKMGIGKPRFHSRHQPVEDLSHPAMAVHLDACIQCKRCVRACREEQVNDVIGYAFRGGHSKIVFDFDDPMGNSTCVACGECVQACPTGALMPARDVALTVPDKTVDSVCPYCGVGCQLTYNVKNNKILFVQGKDGPANSSRLCVKGRYGFDYVQHKHRLTKPLIRKKGAPKHKDFTVDPEKWHEVFREATWEEALDFAAKGLRDVRDTYGKRALAGFGSAKGTNEEAYLFQKLVRTGFGSNNVDHCTRLCHASSVAALMEGINSGAVSNQVRDVANSEVIFVIGANPTVNHPVAATFIKNAAKAGATLIVADPRRGDLARHATYYLQFNPDTDVALLNAMLHVIVEEGLVDQKFIEDRTSGYAALAENVKKFSPEAMAPICGIDATDDPRGGAPLRDVEGIDHSLGHGHLAARARHGQRALPDRAGALDGSDRQAGLRTASAARPEQRAGRVRLGPDSDRLSRLPAREHAGSPRTLREALEDRTRSRHRADRRRDHATRRRSTRSAGCTSWARTRRCRIPTSITRAKRWPRSITSSCRTSSSPKRPTSPTSCCQPRRGRRRSARSPTPIAWCSSDAKRSSLPATRERISG